MLSRYGTSQHARTHTQAPTHTHTHNTQAHTHNTQAQTHVHTQAHTRTHTHTHTKQQPLAFPVSTHVLTYEADVHLRCNTFTFNTLYNSCTQIYFLILEYFPMHKVTRTHRLTSYNTNSQLFHPGVDGRLSGKDARVSSAHGGTQGVSLQK